MFPTPSYSFYPVYSDFYKIQAKQIDLDQNWQIELNDYLNQDSSGVIFPNPNAPTGCSLSLEIIEDFLKQYDSRSAVIVDEAYIDFGAPSAANLINSYPNLIVVRTLSKGFSLAGLRLGYALASEEAVKTLFTVKDSFNSYPVDRISQHIALLALNDNNYYAEINQKIITEREKLSNSLINLGWNVLPSQANFIFANNPNVRGEEVYKKLKNKGILVRWFNKNRIKNYLRISIGTEDENLILLQKIKEIF